MVRATFEPGAQVSRWQKALENPARALKQIGVHMLASSQAAFRLQAWDGKPWPSRQVPNIAGVLLDLKHGENPQGHRFEGRPALKDTGNLVRSLAMRVGPTFVEVGSRMQYAPRAHHGGPGLSETITKEMQDRLWEWLQTDGQLWKFDLGFLLNTKLRGDALEIKAKPRPFVGITEQTRADILEDIGLHVFEVR